MAPLAAARHRGHRMPAAGTCGTSERTIHTLRARRSKPWNGPFDHPASAALDSGGDDVLMLRKDRCKAEAVERAPGWI
jgi:hypothetical protein